MQPILSEKSAIPVADNENGLTIINKLCMELLDNKINYCHWKSNAFLDRSASGKNDLDLLVSRSDRQRFKVILSELGFKQAYKPNQFTVPGVYDFYGYDQPSESLVHVHAHYQLILGHDATKNYHIPVEEYYLASASQKGLFRVPSAEYELIIFVMRMMIKHFTWDTILLGHGILSTSERHEFNTLIEQSSSSIVDGILEEHFPYISTGLFSECIKCISSDCTIWKRIKTGGKLLHALDPFSRYSQTVDSCKKIWSRFYLPVQSRLLRKDLRTQLSDTGSMIAIVGGDGAGKTTIVDDVYKWLAKKYKVQKYHMGKPDWTFLTIVIRAVLKIGRVLGLYPYVRTSNNSMDVADDFIFPGYPYVIREILTARDRYITYKKARRFALHGGMVILDRFPLPQIKHMEGPQLLKMKEHFSKNRLLNWLMSIEENFYKQMALPDLLIILRVDPNVAVQRKTDEDADYVRFRSSEIWEMDWKDMPACIIDADQTKEEVLSEVKQLIWSHI